MIRVSLYILLIAYFLFPMAIGNSQEKIFKIVHVTETFFSLLCLTCVGHRWDRCCFAPFVILVDQAPLHLPFKSQSQLLTSIRIRLSNVNFNIYFNKCRKTCEAKFSHSRQFYMIVHSNFPDCNSNFKMLVVTL